MVVVLFLAYEPINVAVNSKYTEKDGVIDV